MNKYIRENHTFFAIDPSIRACGWALFKKDRITAGLCRSKEKDASLAVIEIYKQLKKKCPVYLNYLIVERPILLKEWTQSKGNDVAKLLACYGVCLALAGKNTRLWTPSVPEWKGQLSKEISYNRTEKILTENGIKFEIGNKIPVSLQHNSKDAIALLARYLTKERIIQ